ncbi:MAG: hypothetical protein J5998_04330 [Clostridia bacterium]|nr:hypothetical protein [Clostridia bacterium]
MAELVSGNQKEINPEEENQLVITARLSPKQYEKAMRYRQSLRELKLAGLILGVFILVSLGIILYFSLTYDEPFADIAKYWLESLGSGRTYLFLALIIFWLVFSIWYYPRRYRKLLVDVHGDQTDWLYRYTFCGEDLVIETSSDKSSSDIRIRYTDIRKIKQDRYSIILKTKGRTSYWIARNNISGEEEMKLLNILRSRCVNAKQRPV